MKRTSRHFLGKEVSRHEKVSPARPQKKPSSWVVSLIIAPLFAGIGLISVSSQPSNPQVSLPRAASAACTTAVGTLESADGGGDIFPLFPAELRDYKKDDGCVPALWNRSVFKLLIYKTLGLLNYIAGAIAVLATIYAGILYLTSYGSEANAKKARGILIGTYAGFFIVLGARLIVQGSFYLFGSEGTKIEEVLKIEESPK